MESSAAKTVRNMGQAMNAQKAMRKDYMKSLWCVILLFFIIGIPGQGLSYSKDETVVAAVTALREITSIDPLLEYLDDQEWFNRFAAIQVLGERKEGRAVEPLLEMLKHENDPAFRKEILIALTGIGGRGAVEPLLTVLKDEQDTPTRKDILVALAEMNDPRVIAAFVDELEKDTFQVYDHPETYLVRLVNGAQDPAMVLLALHARDVAVRQAAAEALDKLGWRPSKQEEEVLYSAAKRDWERCVLLGGISIDILAELLNNAYWSEYASEIGLALGRIDDARAFAVLERALQSDRWYLRETTAEVLGDLGAPCGVEPLIRAVSDHDERVSSKAVEALGKMKASQAQSALVAALMNENSSVRKAAAAALEAMAWNPSTPQEKAAYYAVKQDTEACVALGQAAVMPLLVSASDSFDFEGRDFAVAALAKIGPPAVEPLLAEFASRAESSSVAGNTGADEARSYEFQQANIRRRQAIVRALGEIKDLRAIEPLIRSLADAEIRNTVIEALGKVGSSDANTMLIGLLKDDEPQIRKVTADALGQIGWTPATDAEKAAYYIAGQDWEACERLGPAAVELLLAFVLAGQEVNFDADPIVSVLGRIKDPRAIRPLVWALSLYHFFSDYGVRDENKLVEAVAGFGPAAVGPLMEAMDKRPIILSVSDLPVDSRERVIDILLKNNWAVRLRLWQFLLTVDPASVEDRMSEALGEDLERLKKFFTPSDVDPNRQLIARTLTVIGDARAIPVLAAHLQDWEARYEIAGALRQLQWQPTTEKERIYFLLSGGSDDGINAQWGAVEKVLMDDLDNGDERAVRFALYTFICLGREEYVPKLIEVLWERDSSKLAEAYLNCGHDKLAEAARKWALANGYMVTSHNATPNDGSYHPVSWDSK